MFNDEYICARLVNIVTSPLIYGSLPARVGSLCRHKSQIRVDEFVVGGDLEAAMKLLRVAP